MVLPVKRVFLSILLLAALPCSAFRAEPHTTLTPAAAGLLQTLVNAGDSLILSGQGNPPGRLHRCTSRIEEITKVTPAIWSAGFSMIGRVDNGSAVVAEAYRKYRQGYIVALTWEPSNPNYDPPFDAAQPGYNELSTQDWKAVTTPGSRLYQKFRRDLDRIAWYLKELQRMGVPILWNPFPGSNSQHPWYGGRSGADGLLTLWENTFERLTEHHGLRNLVWVWSVNGGKSSSAQLEGFMPGQDSFHAAAITSTGTTLEEKVYNRLMQIAGDKPVGLFGAESAPGVSLINSYPQLNFFITGAESFDERNTPEQLLDLYQLPSVITHKHLRAEWKTVVAALPPEWHTLQGDSLLKMLSGLGGQEIEGVVLSEAAFGDAGIDSLNTLAGIVARAGLETVYECQFQNTDALFDAVHTAAQLNASLIKVVVKPQADLLFSLEEIASVVPVIDSLLAANELRASLDFHPAVPFEAVRQMLELFKSVWFGLHLNPAYCLINRLDPGHIARTMAPLTLSVDFTDYAMTENDTGWRLREVPPGEGVAGLEGIIEGLKEYGSTAYAMVSTNSRDGRWAFPEGELPALKRCLFPQRPELQMVYGPDTAPSLREKIEGLLIGSAIGDAAGGPVEFAQPIQRSYWSTTEEPLTQQGVEELAALFALRDYPKDIEPYAQWEPYGPAGTITDDTRFKMILFNTLRDNGGILDAVSFAREILEFRKEIKPEYRPYYDEWIPEIRYAARWMQQEEQDALPPERIWGGVPTMMGQMPFLPVAALNPSDPQWCYTAAFEASFFDNGSGRDINAAIVAGLARALQQDGSWLNAVHAMRVTDPYRYNDLLYVERGLDKWISFSHKMVKESRGNIAALFSLLENYMRTDYWWEAWVPLVVVISCAEITGYHPIASMQLMLEFGHDTDSYAQVMGAFMGAIHGSEVFPEVMRKTVNAQMKEQYGQNVNDWLQLIEHYGK